MSGYQGVRIPDGSGWLSVTEAVPVFKLNSASYTGHAGGHGILGINEFLEIMMSR